MFKTILCIFIGLLFTCCSPKKNETKETNEQKETTESPSIKKFNLPPIPTIITEPRERAIYLSRHYWDNLDFPDTATTTPDTNIIEQAFVDYIVLLENLPAEKNIELSFDILAQKISKDTATLNYFINIANKYLYDPNSPMRNEDIYIPFAKSFSKREELSEKNRTKMQFKLKLALKNRVGEPASDFIYATALGDKQTLYKTKGDFILLFINNPDCHMCDDVTRQLKNSDLLNKLLEEKKLTILAFYPDEDLTAWKKHLPEIPYTWINSYDPTGNVRENDIYDLKAIPTLYLLDKDKKVILKDVVSVNNIEYTLNKML